MINIKKHYKIFISIIIIIILISSSIIYYTSNKDNKTYYSPDNYSYTLKYFDDPCGFTPNFTFNHEISSYGIYNNKKVVLNAMIINPAAGCNTAFHGTSLCLRIGVNVTGYIPGISKINIISNKNICIVNCTEFVSNNIKNKSMEYYYKIGCSFKSEYYNLTVTVSIDKYIYDKFNINTIKETAIYGTIGLTPGCGDGYDPYLNSSFFIENNNTHNFHIVNIRNGCFYFFAQPDTEYKLYYLDKYNNTLEDFKSNSGTIISYIKTGSAGSSTPPASLYE